MPYDMTNTEFKDALDRNDADAKVISSFLASLRRNLQRSGSQTSKELLKWMKEGGQLSAFTCRDDVLLNMAEEMSRAGIPYIVIHEVTGGAGILIRECDAKKVSVLTGDVLRRFSTYCRVASVQEAEMTYLQSNDDDKMMIQIGGLTEEEAQHLERKCQTALAGEVIGLDTMPDGTQLFTCHGKTAMESAHASLFRQAVSETFFMMNGYMSGQSRSEERKISSYRQNLAMEFPDRNGTMSEPVWIVGNGQYFVKRTKDGFELGHAVEIYEDVQLETDMVVSALDRRYHVRLNSALSKITGHTCLYEEDEVIEWFKTKRSYVQAAYMEGQKQLAAVMDKMVMKKIGFDSTMQMQGQWSEKLAHYQRETAKLLIAAIKHPGRPPKGYSKDDMDKIKETAQDFGIDMDAMQPAAGRMAHMETFIKEAGPRRIENIMEHVHGLAGIEQPSGRSDKRQRGRAGRQVRTGRQEAGEWAR